MGLSRLCHSSSSSVGYDADEAHRPPLYMSMVLILFFTQMVSAVILYLGK